MLRIKMPGNKKVKLILLIVLVIFASCILINEGINNRRKEQSVDINATKTPKVENQIEKNNVDAKLTENNSSETQKEDSLYEDAYTTFHSGDYQGAISKADQIINEFPNSYKAYDIRGIAKAYNGSFDDGMADIDKALDINPDYGYARFNKALNYELYAHYEEALAWYDKALEVEQYLWSYYGKASIYGRYGDVTNSVANLSKAFEIAAKDGIKDDVVQDAKNECDFNNVKNSEEFQSLLN